jgi:hypothetical protein
VGIRNGGLTANVIEKMVPPLKMQVGISHGISMVIYIERMDLPLSVLVG